MFSIGKLIVSLVLVSACIDFVYSESLCCPACFNGGTLDILSCGCACPKGFQGPRCQYTINPCEAVDSPYCSNVNCFNATEYDFYNCQRKCLCCANKKCHNLGVLIDGDAGSKCQCKCISDLYSPDDGCLKASECKNSDDNACYNQFGGEANCNFAFVRSECPKMCRVC